MSEAPVHRIGVLVFDGVKMLDVAGPAEVFAEANLTAGRYRISMISADGRDVSSSIGMRIPVDASADSPVRYDTVLVAGGDVLPSAPVSPELRRAALELADRSGRIASVCTGAFVLGAAGLLDR